MPELDLLTAPAVDIAKALEAGTVSSEALVQQYLNRIHKYNGYLHAVIATTPTDIILPMARSLDNERAQGRIRGPLHGIPIILKDNIATDPKLGMDTTSGTYALVGSKVGEAAPLAKQLQDAGVLILGKGNLSSAGGSSSGPCVAVAAGLAPMSVGTDTNGSILLPATRGDVFAMKPTLGLISQRGIVPICLEFDSAGPIARCAQDIAALMDVMVDHSFDDKKPPVGYSSKLTGSLDGIRIGVLNPKNWSLPSIVATPVPSIQKQQHDEISAAYGKLRATGATVKEVEIASLDGLEVDGTGLIGQVMNSGFKPDFEAYLKGLDSSQVRTLGQVMQFMKSHADLEFPPESPNMGRLEMAESFVISSEAREEAIRKMRDFGRNQAIDKCLQDNEIDVILGPADSEIDDYYSAAGYPMACLPLSYCDYNMRPFGICALASEY
ncbi:glutamyl-tRNA(gln) amidotransferase subunit A [Fusarium circinatum]|uniref:Glutamyl-tRNA(Gln) amidotransferase subunit A n=1 Tax=Fusarium circinatum TaxID=48490 RepID=A0A8H5TBH8_FUSCI|nr:glutamyl-tRNA(gln) amidotransferase subunit A [Fusarium circinatum]